MIPPCCDTLLYWQTAGSIIARRADGRHFAMRVRDHIAALDPTRFDMARWAYYPRRDGDDFARISDLAHDCETAGCIGGWTESLFPDGSAEAVLGLSFGQRSELFYMKGCKQKDTATATQAEAVAVLDILADTGRVDWDAAIAKVAAETVQP